MKDCICQILVRDGDYILCTKQIVDGSSVSLWLSRQREPCCGLTGAGEITSVCEIAGAEEIAGARAIPSVGD